MTHRSLVPDAEMARHLGETYAGLLYGADEQHRQQPFVASEQGDCWLIEGSWNRDKKLSEEGWFYAVIWKYDGRIVDFGIRLHIEYSPADRELINKAISGTFRK